MGKKISVGIANVSRRCPKGWVGVNNLACKIKKGWIGDANGKAQPFFSSGVDAGEVVFTASKTWIVPEGVKTIDIFCVGGGGGRGSLNIDDAAADTYHTYNYRYGGGGGGGYTETLLNVPVTPGENLDVVVGAGGTSGGERYLFKYNGSVIDQSGAVSAGGNGGVSSVYRGSTVLLEANGGDGGKTNAGSSYTAGSNGGSGGGTGGSLSRNENYNTGIVTATLYMTSQGGVDGSDSSGTVDIITIAGGHNTTTTTAGKGQGTTTRYFGESGKTLYSKGGGGVETSEVANSGNGGGFDAELTANYRSVKASSGVVIIRWPEQED